MKKINIIRFALVFISVMEFKRTEPEYNSVAE